MEHCGVSCTGVLHSATQGFSCKRALKHSMSVCVCVHACALYVCMSWCPYACDTLHPHVLKTLYYFVGKICKEKA